MSTQVFLVAFSVDAADRTFAEGYLMGLLPRPAGLSEPSNDLLECWWVAEDVRHDGSDNDSAVFVSPGAQRAAVTLLHQHGLTPACNLSQGSTESPWEAPEESQHDRDLALIRKAALGFLAGADFDAEDWKDALSNGEYRRLYKVLNVCGECGLVMEDADGFGTESAPDTGVCIDCEERLLAEEE